MARTRVLIVDDSSTMRALIRHALSGDPAIEIVGEATDPADARQKIKLLDPDVVTLDIEMPGMNGLEFLEKIMRLRPTPVIMVSTLTQPGADATISALEIGAFDCVGKPGREGGDTLARLPELVRQAHAARGVISSGGARIAAAKAPDAFSNRSRWPDLVAIGSSTGGVEALLQLLPRFPADTPPVLVVQHLPASFTASFAARLDRACPAKVVVPKSGETIARGHVYLAPGGLHLSVRRVGGSLACTVREDDPVQGHRPSVDVMMRSVAECAGGRAAGIILTGMGRDGADGLLAMAKAGHRTVAQDEATSLVYGMPRVAWQIGAAQKRVPLGRIADEIFA
jgi:two-component system, chemotaxis family, protein-glutamate methylesterase/glutaminase